MRTITPVQPPDPSTYETVMRRLDRDPRFAHQQRFASYDCLVKGVAVKHPDGKVATTLFFPPGKNASVIRARRVGWIDVTSLWSPDIEAKETPITADRANPEGVQAGSPTEEALKKLTWPALQELARSRNTRQTGSRDAVETGILKSYQQAD